MRSFCFFLARRPATQSTGETSLRAESESRRGSDLETGARRLEAGREGGTRSRLSTRAVQDPSRGPSADRSPSTAFSAACLSFVYLLPLVFRYRSFLPLFYAPHLLLRLSASHISSCIHFLEFYSTYTPALLPRELGLSLLPPCAALDHLHFRHTSFPPLLFALSATLSFSLFLSMCNPSSSLPPPSPLSLPLSSCSLTNLSSIRPERVQTLTTSLNQASHSAFPQLDEIPFTMAPSKL